MECVEASDKLREEITAGLKEIHAARQLPAPTEQTGREKQYASDEREDGLEGDTDEAEGQG
jgi:hypothetical protein